MEVDASDSGVGAIQLQVSEHDNKIHPCAFFTLCLSPAEYNFDVGDRELLAVKIGFEEWRHWLARAELTVVVWIKHKNLAYLQEAKNLNARQSSWSRLFLRFNFIISYPPKHSLFIGSIQPIFWTTWYRKNISPYPMYILVAIHA